MKQEFVKPVLHGRPLHYNALAKKPDIKKSEVVVIFSENKFIGMFRVIEGKDIFAKAEFTMQEIPS